jgi:hypothetical protein
VPSAQGSDTNGALFESSLAAMRRAVPKPDVVVLPGDFFMHRFAAGVTGSPDAAGVRTIAKIAGGFDRAFPNAQFVVALGNNDAPCGDYRSELGSPYLKAVARVWAPLVNRHGTAPDFEKSFADNGYYVAAVAPLHLRIVALDTVLSSRLYGGNCGPDAKDASARQFAWLNQTLRATPPGTRNVVLMHVPPGYDPFATHLAHGLVAWSFLRDADNVKLIDALSAPSNRVVFAIAGHTHRFGIRIAGNVPIVGLGSISPIYDSDPAFYVLHVDRTGVADLDAWTFDAASQVWSARSFDRTQATSRIDAPSLLALHERTKDTTDRISWCAQTELTTGFIRCANIQRRVALLPFALVAIALSAVAGFWWLLRRLRRRRTT